MIQTKRPLIHPILTKNMLENRQNSHFTTAMYLYSAYSYKQYIPRENIYYVVMTSKYASDWGKTPETRAGELRPQSVSMTSYLRCVFTKSTHDYNLVIMLGLIEIVLRSFTVTSQQIYSFSKN